MKHLLGALCLATLLYGTNPVRVAAQDPDKPADAKAAAAKALAKKIDELIEAKWKDTNIKPAPKADDATYLRRLHLDLVGRIPSLLDVRDYMDNDGPNKLEEEVDKLLASDGYAKHFGAVWRSLMLQGTNNQQVQFLQAQFEAWLRMKLQNNLGYDKLVHELLTQPNGAVVYGGVQASPQAFYFANENKPENLAGATSRMFLGVKLECAQCHKHPFAKWTKQQFWEYAAFFAGTPNQFGGRRPGVVNPDAREIKIPNSDKVAKATFLGGKEPEWKQGVSTRTTLADWMTAPDNPYFAKAAVDHVWYYFFGVSLLEPILEPNDDSPPAHPELLDELARQFVAQGFDLKFLIRAIVQTQAYQRSSGSLKENREEIYLFARMSVRGMTPEQLFDSLCEATEYIDPYANQPIQPQQFNQGLLTPRAAFLSKFGGQLDKRLEAQTSILQALFMMNGKFLAERTKLENNKSLFTIATTTTPARRVETLYLLVLSRLPTQAESDRLVRYIERGGANGDPRQAVADVYWALLNSGEFMLIH